MAVGTEQVIPEVKGWLQDNVTGGREVSDDEQIIENGVLTSLQTVELVMFLEDRFDITVEDEELNEEDFGSVNSIAGLVAGKKS